jgi:hypothetical protein
VVDLNGKLRLHPDFKVEALPIGAEHQPVLVVDHFLDNAQVLVDYAAAHCEFDGVSDAFYPGMRAPIPPIYCFALRAFLGGIIGDAFGLKAGAVTGELGHFSLVTTPPDKLKLVQRMPHFDNTNPKQLAVLHYLCPQEHGGTSFYRHRRTGYEYVDEPRKQAYSTAVTEDLQALVPAGTLPLRRRCHVRAHLEPRGGIQPGAHLPQHQFAQRRYRARIWLRRQSQDRTAHRQHLLLLSLKPDRFHLRTARVIARVVS